MSQSYLPIFIKVKEKVLKSKVYDYLRTIPKGKVTTYGKIAEYLGNNNLCRVVGNILHNNPDPDLNPCYKVVSSLGKLSTHYAYGGIREQRRRLEEDGIVVNDDKLDLKKYLFR